MWDKTNMNWLLNVIEDVKWKFQDVAWWIEGKVEQWKLRKENSETDYQIAEEIEVKPKKKKKKSKKK